MATVSIIFTWIIIAFMVRLLIRSVVINSGSRTYNNQLPGPPSLPIIGHLHLLSSSLPKSLEKLAGRYGPIMQIFMGGQPVVVISDSVIAKQMLKTQDLDFASKFMLGFGFSKFNIYDGNSFINSQYGPYWKFMKKLCKTQLFAGPQLDRFIHIREQEMQKLLKSIVGKSEKEEPCDLGTELSDLANNILCKMAVGKRCAEYPNLPVEIRKSIRGIMEATSKLSFNQVFGPLKKFDLSGQGKRLITATLEYDRLLERLFKDYEDNLTNDSGQHGKDVIDILLEVYRETSTELKITRNQIKTFFLEIFLAGVDSTAASIQWAIAELITKPEILKKLIEEIHSVVGSNRLVKESDIQNLPYLQAIIKETLRKHPTGPLLRRESNVDTKINGYDVKAGTKILINAYAIMQDPIIFKEPEKFMPERFMIQHQEMDFYGQDFHFLPFGSGRRACIGLSHGLILMSTAIASLIQCFDWKLKDGDMFDLKLTSGYSGAMAVPLVCYPILRFNPFKL